MDELVRALQHIDTGYREIARMMADLEIQQHELLKKVFGIDCARMECPPCRISTPCLMITAASSMWREQHQEIMRLLEQAGVRLPAGTTCRGHRPRARHSRRAPAPASAGA